MNAPTVELGDPIWSITHKVPPILVTLWMEGQPVTIEVDRTR